MIRNVLDSPFIFLMIMLALSLLLSICMRHRRGDSSRKASALFLMVFCSGYFLMFLFVAMEPSLAAPAEIEGRVSQVDLRFPLGRRGDHSQFEVTSPSGLRVKLDSEHHLAESLQSGETVYVRYDPLTFVPYRVERLDGSEHQLLFENHFPRWMTVTDWAMLALLALVAIYQARQREGTTTVNSK
jgi:hypothetical protein